MVFRKRSKQPTPDTPESGASPSPESVTSVTSQFDGVDAIPAERALDFMAELLRILGQNAFDIGTRSAE